MKSGLILFFLIIFIKFNVFAGTRDLDSVYKVPMNPLWSIILSNDSYQGKIFTQFPNNYIIADNSLFKNNDQEIIKRGK
jgi:hypothetical protein